MVVWKAQGVPQSNDAAYSMHQEEMKPLKNKLHRVTSNRNFIMQKVQFVFTVMARIHVFSSKLWQKLPQ